MSQRVPGERFGLPVQLDAAETQFAAHPLHAELRIGQSTTGSFVFTNSFYSSVPGCLAVDGADQDGVKYFVSGKSVTVTLSGGSSYSAVDGASNPVALTDNGGGSYTLTMPAADVTISAN